MDSRIPLEYRKYWEPFKTKGILYHVTAADNLDTILKNGLEPCDPRPKYWGGIVGIWMSYPRDALHETNMEHILAHVKGKGSSLVKLHIKTKVNLWRSTDPQRTNQVMALDPISPEDIVGVEGLSSSYEDT